MVFQVLKIGYVGKILFASSVTHIVTALDGISMFYICKENPAIAFDLPT